MADQVGELRDIVGKLARLVGEMAVATAKTGAFDADREHVSGLLQALDTALRAARIRHADAELLEAILVVRNEEQAPRVR